MSHRFFRWPILVAVFLAVATGVHEGLFSCGAPRWHLYLRLALLIFGSVLPVVIHAAPTTKHRLSLYLVLSIVLCLSVYRLAMAASAPFYPAPPTGVVEWWLLFVQALRFGAC